MSDTCELLANSFDRTMPGVVACVHEAKHSVTILTGRTHPTLGVCDRHALQCSQMPGIYRVDWRTLPNDMPQ